jgi:polar amino acid transport system substrate-binding protein
MNKSLHRIAGLILGVFSQSLMALDLSVVHTGNWPPYAAEELPGQGLAVELVTTALQRAGYTVNLRADSLDRILEGTRLGVYDVFATPWYSDDRNRYLDYSDPYLDSTIRFIKRKETDFKYTGLDGLKGMTIGVVQDYAYDPDFDQAHNFNRTSERNLIQNLLKLTQKRLQLTLDDELVLQYEINRFMPKTMKDLEFVQRPLAIRGVHIGVSRENPKHAMIVADFNKAMKEMINDGSYSEIMKKHKAYVEQAAE